MRNRVAPRGYSTSNPYVQQWSGSSLGPGQLGPRDGFASQLVGDRSPNRSSKRLSRGDHRGREGQNSMPWRLGSPDILRSRTRSLVSTAGAPPSAHSIQRERLIAFLQIRMLVEIGLHRRVIGEHFRTALAILLKGQVVLREKGA